MIAYYALLDDIKIESKRAIKSLHAMGIKTVMLTGDQERTANYVAQKLGIDEVVANCMPQDKVAKLAELKTKYGFVAMVEMVLMMLLPLLKQMFLMLLDQEQILQWKVQTV